MNCSFLYERGACNPKFTFRNAKLVVYFHHMFYGNINIKLINMKEKENMTLGEKIAKQRKELNYTQEQLADILGVSRQSISKWESDIAYPETEKLIELGKIFDCSMDYLLKEDVMEKDGAQTTIFSEISKKAITQENKEKTKKILKSVGIILGVVLAIDIVSMILYFYILGFPT